MDAMGSYMSTELHLKQTSHDWSVQGSLHDMRMKPVTWLGNAKPLRVWNA